MPETTIKKYLIVQTEGDRQVSRSIDHYNLQMIIAVGFKVNNERAGSSVNGRGKSLRTIPYKAGRWIRIG